jgi:hypothetical protein
MPDLTRQPPPGQAIAVDYELMKRLMWDEDEFWSVIERAAGDPGTLRSLLEPLDRDRLIGFAWRYEDLSGEVFGELQELGKSPKSEDALNDFAAATVARGKDAYYAVMDDPDSVPEDVPHDQREELMWVAGTVFHERFGAELPPVGYAE